MALNYLPNGEPDYRAQQPPPKPLPTREESHRAIKALHGDTTSHAYAWHRQRIEHLDSLAKEGKSCS